MAKQKITSAQIESQQVWQVPTLQNGWVDYSAAYEQTAYMKDSLGFVHVRGCMKNGTTTLGTLLFTLPAGYRPARAAYLPCSNLTTYAGCEITAGGLVNFISGNNTFYSLGHIVFRAEN